MMVMIQFDGRLRKQMLHPVDIISACSIGQGSYPQRGNLYIFINLRSNQRVRCVSQEEC